MARGGDDHVVAHLFEPWQRRAIDPRLGNDRREVVPRVGAAIFGNSAEVAFEVVHHASEGLCVVGRLTRRRSGAGRIWILWAEQLLGEPQHARLVLLGHTEDLHDHMQRIEHGHVRDEIAAAAERRHAVHRRAGDRTDAGFKLAQIAGEEPSLGQGAVLRMLRGVHLHQALDQVRAAARDAPHKGVALAVGQGRLSVAVVEQVRLALDIEDVGVLGNHPERIEALGSGEAKGVVRTKPAEGVMDPAIGVGARIDDCGGDVGRDLGTRFGHSVSFSSSLKFDPRLQAD